MDQVSGKQIDIKKQLKRFSTLILLLVLVVICSCLNRAFLTPGNIFNIFKQLAPVIVISIGETYLIIAGQIDLSPGSMIALTAVTGALAYNSMGSSIGAIALVVLVGAFAGAVNGFFVTRYKLPAFIVTLGMQMLARGMALYLSKGQTIKTNGSTYKVLGQGSILGIPNLFLVTILLLLIFWFILDRTAYGRYLYAIGGNEEAAKSSGVNVNKVKIAAFVICGALSGFAGIMLGSRLNAGQPTVGDGYEFDAIIGAVVGGASLNGGIGTLFGTFIGCIIIGVLNNILNLLNVSPYLQDVAKGILILTAVTVDAISKNRKEKVKVLPIEEEKD